MPRANDEKHFCRGLIQSNKIKPNTKNGLHLDEMSAINEKSRHLFNKNIALLFHQRCNNRH
jgi:hypothetical protein